MPQSARKVDEEAALRAVVEGTACETGEAFYRALVKNLAGALDTKGAWLTEYYPDRRRLNSLAFWFGGQWIDQYEYDVTGTPCEKAVDEVRLIHIPDRIVDLYPNQNERFREEGIVSYLGMPILDAGREVIGNLAVVDARAMPPEKLFLDLFHIFANRAMAEMRRLRLEGELRSGRERLSGLIDSAMDAIVELDAEHRITLMNTAAERLFACSADAVHGQAVARLLGETASGTLTALARELDGRTEGDPFLWIPDGLAAVPGDSDPFQAEATLSRFERKGSVFYTLILRNVEDRIRAERKIRDLTAQTTYLREEIEAEHGFSEIVGKSPALREALKAVVQVAGTEATVLLTGETGTGKEVFARAIHSRSARRDKPMIKVNCAAIPESLMESEFFGHERGAFTGATQRREGRFALADGGTIFLDEIGELPMGLQGKLLRVLQEGEFEPVGASHTKTVDVRVLVATNRDLQAMVKAGTFREDLYYRLAVFPLPLPPLRERGDDIVLLASAILERLGRDLGRKVGPLSSDAVRALKAYAWPGNVRELRNVIERALITSPEGNLQLSGVLPRNGTDGKAAAVVREDGPSEGGADPGILTEERLRALERKNMIAALDRCDWQVGGKGGAAELLGISPSTFKSRMKTMGITRS